MTKARKPHTRHRYHTPSRKRTSRRTPPRSPGDYTGTEEARAVPVYQFAAPTGGQPMPSPTAAQVQEQTGLIRLIAQRLEPLRTLAVAITAITAGIAALWGAWVWLDAPQLVTNKGLRTSQVEIGNRIQEMRVEVLRVAREASDKADRNRIEMLEFSMRSMFSQRTSLQDAIISLDDRLKKNPHDTVVKARLLDFQNFLKFVDAEINRVRELLVTLRGEGHQQPEPPRSVVEVPLPPTKPDF